MNETCGCCEGVEAVTPLSTVNRPGLGALTYRVGTHATFLQTMIARLSSAENPALRGLTTRTANDPSIAFLDAWATVADVLTFYQERIANEGYLRTATERLSILELARLVGYVPRPGVAASVYLALTLEDGYRTEIPAGIRAQSLPGPGELPQFFETSEALGARAEWNVLTPRLSRPQSLRPFTPRGDDTPRGRLYLKGVSTNLGPNDPLLVESGPRRLLIKVRAVEPDPERDRTLVTFTLPRPSTVTSTRPGTGDRVEAFRQRVEGLLDLEAHRVSAESETTRRVVGLLEDLKARLTRGTPPGELADSLRETVLPGVRQDLGTARERSYTRLTPWLERIEGELQEIELASSRLGVARASGATFGPFAGTGEENSRTTNAPSATLEGLLDRLGKPPSVQPASAAKLSRSLAKSFGADSDVVPQLLSALRPDLGRALYQAWEQTGAEPSTVSIYALRVIAAPFGHNAPPRAILRDGEIQRYEEWTLERTTQITGQPFEVTITVRFDFEGPAAIQIDVTIEDETSRQGPQELEDGTFQLAFPRAREAVAGTISDVEGDRFGLTLAFRNSGALVQLRDRVEGDVVIGTRRDEAEPTTRIRVDITKDDEFEVIGESSDPINVTVGRDDRQNRQIVVGGEIRASSTEPTEKPDVIALDATYKEIVPESWVVVERPDPDEEGTSQTVISRAEQVREASRADYGITAKGTQITLYENWLYPNRDDFAVIRGTSVYAAPELLELADAPPEVIDENGLVRVEPIAGGRIELDALYDGLEPGRWLFVTGERDDLPGVLASELVMLAGVEQGVQLVSLRDEDLPRVGEATALRLTGRGSTGPGGLDLAISARRATDGSVSGYAHLVGGATGEVVGIIPPDDEWGFWCINVRRTDTGPNSGDQRINWYVRDAGDGITSFDEISATTSIGGDCDEFPEPTGAWLRLVKGDFHVSAEEPTGDKVHSTIILAGDLAYPYKRETVRIYGNVVNATHGETRPEVLGSGDGGAAFQKFSLKQSPLTHVAATTPSGVESTLEVYVNDIRWHEAGHLSGLQPKDRRFITQTDDEGEVTVVFGDGQRGARLPTGVENVRAVYRTGIGKAGNVAEGQISLLATRPLGLKGVINPQPATGGADRETREGARRNAPLGVKVLDRLVSARDYEDFARAFAGIGKASSARLSDGRQHLVHLTIAGADDIPIAETSGLYRNLLQALLRFGDPQQPIRVEVRELLLLIVSAGVRLLPDYLWEAVESEIRAVLLETFGFEQRDLGQDALLSEVMSTVQHVPGVAYVDVDTFGGIPEKTVDTTTGLRRVLLPSEIEAEITRLAQSEDQPYQRVRVDLAGSEGISIRPAQLAFLTPLVPDTLILKEITA